MAVESTAQFREVVEIQVQTESFVKGLNELKAQYLRFVEELGEAAQGFLQAGTFSQSVEDVKALKDGIQDVSDTLAKFADDTQEAITEVISQVTNLSSTSTEKQLQDTKKSLEARVAAEKKVAEAKAATDKFKRVRDTGELVERDEQRALEENLKREIAAERESIDARIAERKRYFKELQDQLKERVKQDDLSAKERAKLERDQVKLADQLLKEQLGLQKQYLGTVRKERELNAKEDIRLQNDAIKQARANFDELIGQVEKRGAAQTKAIKDQVAAQNEYTASLKKSRDAEDREAAKAQNDSIRQARTQFDELVGQLDKRAAAKKKAHDEEVKLENDLAKVKENRQRAADNFELLSIKDKQGKIDLLSRRLEAVNKQIESAKVPSVGAGGTAATPDLRTRLAQQKELEALEQKQLGIQRQMAGINNQNERSFLNLNKGLSGFITGLKSALDITLRFYASFVLVQAVLDAIAAPFRFIILGLDKLRQTEDEMTGLLAVLETNVKFAEQYEENIAKVHLAAEQVTEDLRKQAALLKISPDALVSTFKAMVEGGVLKYVRSLKEAIDISVLFQQSLAAVGAGGLVAQASVQEVGKLFNSIPAANSPFLRALRLSVGDWVKIRTEAQATGGLILLLSSRSEAFRKQLEASGKSQAVLLENFKEMVSRLAAEGSKPLFSSINEGLIKFGSYISDHKEEIVATFQRLSAAIAGVGQALLDIGTSGGISVLETLINLASRLGEVVASNLAFIAASALTIKAAYENTAEGWKRAADAQDRYVEHSKRAIFGADGSPDLGKLPFNHNGKIINRSILGDRVTAVNQPPTADQVSSQLISDFEARRAEIEKQINKLENDADDARNSIKEKIAEGTLSYVDGAQTIANITLVETTRIEALEQSMVRLATAARGALAAKDGVFAQTDPKNAQQGVARLTKTLADLGEAADNRREKSSKTLTAADIAAERELQQVRLLNSEDLRKQSINRKQEQVNLNRELLSQELITQVQAFDNETELQETQFKANRERLVETIELYADGHVKRVEFEKELAEVERQNAANSILRERQRTQVTIEQSRLRARIEADSIQSEADIRQAILNTERTVNTRFNVFKEQDAILAERQRSIDVLAQQTQAELLNATANQKNATEVQNLRNRYNELIATREQLINQRVAAGTDGINDPNVAFERGSQIRRKAAQESAARDSGNLGTQVAAAARASIGDLIDAIFGRGVKETFNGATSALGKLVAGANGAVAALANIQGIINTIKQGIAQGGILGGVGSGVSSVAGLLGTNILKKIPVIGEFLPAIGGILSFVGTLFTASAKKIAEDIKKSFRNTIDSYQNGNSTLVQTLQLLEQQRQAAIVRLSGKKGGSKELESILPDFDNEIKQLKNTQAQIVSGFEDSLTALREQNDVLQDVRKKWQDINQQVKDYIGAGGDATKAAEFLTLQLAAIRRDAAESLADSEKDAIQEAIKLNDLLVQRADLIKDFKQQEFDLITEGAIDRRQAGSVRRGKELEQLRSDHQKALDDIDQEIELTQKKVDMQKQVFDLASDTASLRRRDEELTLQALDQQIQKLKALKDIVSGNFLSGLASVVNTVNVSVQFNGPVGSEEAANSIIDSVTDELARLGRSGLS